MQTNDSPSSNRVGSAPTAFGTHHATIGPNDVIERARRYVAAIPAAVQGNGGDSQTLAVANKLVWDFALSLSEALPLLQEYNVRCSPSWTEAELIRKINSALKQPHTRPRGNLLCVSDSGFVLPVSRRSHSKRTTAANLRADPATVTENFLGGFRCDHVDLWEASPVRPPDDWTKDALAMLAFLYEPGEQINFVTEFKLAEPEKAKPCGQGETVERHTLLARWTREGLPRSDAGGWLRMNPLDGEGVADANVTAFRFALVECDSVPMELQLPLLAKLPLPIAAILSSGGRSLHAWVHVAMTLTKIDPPVLARSDPPG